MAKLMLASAVAVALGLAACADDDGTKFSKRTLKFTERPTANFGFADNPPKTQLGDEGPRSLSNGDAVTFSSDLVDGAGADRGDLDVSCTITRPGGFAESHQTCLGTAMLPGGSLTLSRGGRVFGGDSSSGAIVGGTGTYAGATGHFEEAEERGGRTPYAFHVLVPER